MCARLWTTFRASFVSMNARMGRGQFAGEAREVERGVQKTHALLKKIRDDDEAARLMVRAEMDGLWTAIYQLANRLDEMHERTEPSDD